MIPQHQFQVITLDFDASVGMNGNHLHFDDRQPVLVRFLSLDPVQKVAGPYARRNDSEALQNSRMIKPP